MQSQKAFGKNETQITKTEYKSIIMGSFDNSIEKREVENIGHKITITVGDITDDIMPLFEKSVEEDIKAKLEMYRKIYDRQVKERSRKASEQVIIRGPFAK